MNIKQVKFHTLHWNNISTRMVELHKAATKHIGLDITYWGINQDHGAWMDDIVRTSKDELIGFMDVDCIPISLGSINRLSEWVVKNKSMVGTAQVSNHYPPANHIYAAPAFMIVHRDLLNKVDTSFKASREHRSDVAELFSYLTENYRALYPELVHKPKWKLHNYGYYGIGTVYEHGIFHLFESRLADNLHLFEQMVDFLLNFTNPIAWYDGFSKIDKEILKTNTGYDFVNARSL